MTTSRWMLYSQLSGLKQCRGGRANSMKQRSGRLAARNGEKIKKRVEDVVAVVKEWAKLNLNPAN
jgi:hypothetical protein